MIVVDTNVIAYLILQAERFDEARAVFERDPDWSAPQLWHSEFRNVLALYLRQGLLSLGDALTLADRAEALMAGRVYEVPSARVLALVAHSTCSAYDCEFVALAQDLGVPLVTADQRILREFPDTAQSLGEFGRT